MNEIQRADPAARRMIGVVIGCGALAGAVLITLGTRFRPAFEAWVERDLPARLMVVVVALLILTSGPVLVLAAYFWRLGRRSIRNERSPPPGLRLLRDTPILTGEAAARRGRLLQRLGVVLCVAAVLEALFLWRFLTLLK